MIANVYSGRPHSTLNKILVSQRAVCVYNCGPFRTACPKQAFCPRSNSQSKVVSVTREMSRMNVHDDLRPHQRNIYEKTLFHNWGNGQQLFGESEKRVRRTSAI